MKEILKEWFKGWDWERLCYLLISIVLSYKLLQSLEIGLLCTIWIALMKYINK
jgi:hypothetical protein